MVGGAVFLAGGPLLAAGEDRWRKELIGRVMQERSGAPGRAQQRETLKNIEG